MKTTTKTPAVKKTKVEKSEKVTKEKKATKSVEMGHSKKAEKAELNTLEEKSLEGAFAPLAVILPVTPLNASIQAIRKEDLGENPILAAEAKEKLQEAEEKENNKENKKDEEEVPGISETAQERSAREAKELLEVSARDTVPEVDHARNSKMYLAIGIVIAVLVGIGLFFGYKILNSPQKNKEASASSLSATKTAEAPVTPAPPVETIVIADNTATAGSQEETISTASDPKIFKEPDAFKSFKYDASVGKKIVLSGTCHDAYYAFLIFDSKKDYRTDPGAAKSNRAFACPSSHRIVVDMNLQDLNLEDGTYYVFIADQGATGSWYNSR